jgi:hypothetical protein
LRQLPAATLPPRQTERWRGLASSKTARFDERVKVAASSCWDERVIEQFLGGMTILVCQRVRASLFQKMEAFGGR